MGYRTIVCSMLIRFVDKATASHGCDMWAVGGLPGGRVGEIVACHGEAICRAVSNCWRPCHYCGRSMDCA